jgi:hypothetical protein
MQRKDRKADNNFSKDIVKISWNGLKHFFVLRWCCVEGEGARLRGLNGTLLTNSTNISPLWGLNLLIHRSWGKFITEEFLAFRPQLGIAQPFPASA